MNVTETFRAALLLYVRNNIRMNATEILDWEQRLNAVCCASEDCYCGPPEVTMEVSYTVTGDRDAKPRIGDGKIVKWWVFNGDLVKLIQVVDADVIN